MPDDELIEHFLLLQLPPAQHKQFEQRLQNDAILQTKTKAMQLLLLGIQEVALRKKMQSFHAPLESVAPVAPVRSFSIKKWLAAACVLLLAGLAIWQVIKPAQSETLYTRYYRPDPGLISAMGNSSNYDFEKAMIAYKTGDYAVAAQMWRQQLQQKPANDTLQYFTASAYLAQKQTDAAIPLFEQVIASPQSQFRADALWYLGMVMLWKGNQQRAIPLISQSEHPRKTEVLEALKK